MKVRLNRAGRFDEYQYSKKLLLTKQWQTVTPSIGKALLLLSWKGQPLVEADDAEAGNAEVEDLPEESEDGEQEGES
jgi:hypothetical protein